MPEIKRPNYFTSQFLVEKDFNDEQAYHLIARRRHNRQLHTSGVANGLDVTRVSATQVQLGVGTALDGSGREIVLNDALTYTLATAGNDLDVFLTVAYQEIFDPADHDTQAGLDKFTRTTEHVLVQDGTAVPPTDGSVVVLAKIRLSSTGAIASSSSIDTTVRTLSSAAVAPKAINSAQLADGAVTLAKLATEALPMAVLGTNAITVNTNTALKQITVGESHSARVDNPHATTATQIDSQGGANQLVARINAGTGVIVRSRLESTVVSGVMTFQGLMAGMEMFSGDIDPGFGPGALCVQLAFEDLLNANFTLSGDTGYARNILARSEVNRNTGRFNIIVLRPGGTPPGNVSIRWYAFKPVAGAIANTVLNVTVNPNPANLISGSTQLFTALVSNTTSTGVTWSIVDANDVVNPNGGTLSGSTPTTTMYTPPIQSGTYFVKATSTVDPTKKGNATVVMNADVTVTITNGPSVTVFRGAQLVMNATVINTPNTGVTWSVSGTAGSGGTIVAGTGNSATYTAPTAPGTYTVTATSVAAGAKFTTCQINVPAVGIAITADTTVIRGTSVVLAATVSNATDTGATWSTTGGSVVPIGTGATATFTAPAGQGVFNVTATSKADTQKSAICHITVPAVSISISPDANPVQASHQTTIRSTITGSNDPNVTWTSQSLAATVSPTVGPTTTWTAPGVGGSFGVTGTSVADNTKSQQITITVPNVKNPTTEGGGKFLPVLEQFTVDAPVSPQASAPTDAKPADEHADTSAKAKPFVRPKKRQDPKLPPKPSDE